MSFLKISLKFLKSFRIYEDFLHQYKEISISIFVTKKLMTSHITEMSAVFYFQPTLNRSFNNCIELHQFWISSVVLLEIWRKRGIRGWWGVGQKKLLSKSSALLGLNSGTNVFILFCELYRFVRILSWLQQFYHRCENIAIVKILSPL